MLCFLYSLALTALVLYQFAIGTGDNGFSMVTTSEDIIHAFGCPQVSTGDYTVAITGATSGIGEETARHLLDCGAHVFVGGRSEESAKAAIKRLGASGASTSKAVPWVASLSTIAEAAAAGKALVDAKVPLHALVLNAGVMGLPERRVTADNLEMTMAVNHVAHAALARAARPALTAASACEKPRLVVVSSGAHPAASPSFLDSPVLEGSSYGRWTTYGDSKMANILFARGAAQHWPEVTSVSLHPGAILTNLSRHTDGASAAAFALFGTLRDFNVPIFKTVSQGAATTLYALIAPEVAGLSGAYFENAHQAQPSGLYMEPAKAEYTSTLWSSTWKVVDKVLAKK